MEQQSFLDRIDKQIGKPMAYFYIFIFTIVENITAVTIKIQLHDVPPFQQVYFRGMFMILINYYFAKKVKKIEKLEVIDMKALFFILLRSTFGLIVMITYYIGIQTLYLSEFYTILQMNPIFAIIFGCILQKQKIKFSEYMCIIIGAMGALFIIKPVFIFGHQIEEIENADSNIRLFGLVSVFMTSICFPISLIVLQKVPSHVQAFQVSQYYSTFLTIFPPIICIITGQYFYVNSIYQVLGFFACGVVAFIQQFVLFRSVQIENFSKTSIMFYLLILNGCLLDIMLLNKLIEWNVQIGGTLIIATAFIMLRKAFQQEKEKLLLEKEMEMEKEKEKYSTIQSY